MTESTMRELATGLGFPEGPTVLPDGDLAVTDVRLGRVWRIAPDGATSVLAEVGGGANGSALAPDGSLIVVNNGGLPWSERNGLGIPVDEHGSTRVPGARGWVDRIDLATGGLTRLADDCDGEPFLAPNDIVVDADGGIWFTDLGRMDARTYDRGAVYYASADGSVVRLVARGMLGANGIGLSPDGSTLYVAETSTGRLLAWTITGPGEVDGPQRVVAATPDHFDSLAVEADGTVVIAAINHGLCLVRPDGSVEHVAVPGEAMTTNICFGGDDLRTAYITASSTGRVLTCHWPRPGLRLHHT